MLSSRGAKIYGGFIKKTGHDSNSNFFYAALQYTF